MFSLWTLSFLEYYGTKGHQAAIWKYLIHASLLSAAPSWSPSCWQTIQVWSRLLAGLACCAGSPHAAARALKLLTWYQRQRIAQPAKCGMGATYFALQCRSLYEVNAIVQIIEIGHGGGNMYCKGQLLLKCTLSWCSQDWELSSVGIHWVSPSPAGNIASSTSSKKCHIAV